MSEFAYLFPLFFVGVFVLVLYILSRKGWYELGNTYRFSQKFQGNRVGIISAMINGVNYKNCLLLKYDDTGFYLKPIFIFRLFHTPVLIPWKEVISVHEKKVLFSELRELVIGMPTVATILLSRGTAEKLRYLNTPTLYEHSMR